MYAPTPLGAPRKFLTPPRPVPGRPRPTCKFSALYLENCANALRQTETETDRQTDIQTILFIDIDYVVLLNANLYLYSKKLSKWTYYLVQCQFIGSMLIRNRMRQLVYTRMEIFSVVYFSQKGYLYIVAMRSKRIFDPKLFILFIRALAQLPAETLYKRSFC